MILKLFEIQSYRSCIKSKFPLHNELTALIGINGSGKSNILNGLLLLKKICQVRNRPVRRDSSYNRCGIYAEIEHDKKTLFMKADVHFSTDERNFDDVQYSRIRWNFREFIKKKDWVDVPFDFYAFRNSYQMLGSSQNPDMFRYRHYGYDPFYQHRLTTISLKKIQPIVFNAYSFFSGINYYSASQFSDPSRCPVSIELEEDRLTRKMRVNIGHEQFLLDLYKSWKAKNTIYKRFLNTVNKDGIGLIDNLNFTEVDMPSSSYQVQSGGKIKKIERSRLLIVPNFTVDGIVLSPNQLSEGTLKTLALLFYVLTDESKLLLIEEPEVCIHHGLLNSIISLIKTQSKRKQIVLSTHSDFVLDQLSPENLLLVQRKTENGSTAKVLSKLLSKNDYQALRSYLKDAGNLGEYWKEGGLTDD
jgi:ABC-type cobalamin/Fe3+-siderophores transport system ATPase subunit